MLKRYKYKTYQHLSATLFTIIICMSVTGCVSFKIKPGNKNIEIVRVSNIKTTKETLVCKPPPTVIDGHIMVPLTAVRDATESELIFDKKTKTASLFVNTPKLYFDNHNFKSEAINLIKNARKQIFVEMYALSDKEMIEALAKKQKTGVKVCVIIDDEYAYLKSNKDVYKQKGLKVRTDWVSNKTYIMHRKVCIIDSLYVTIGSSNWTFNALGYDNKSVSNDENMNAEINMVYKSKDLAFSIEQEFYKNWRLSKDLQ